MPWLRIALLCLSLCGLVACGWGDSGQNLLSVQNFSPKLVDVGERLELVGTGFPEGKNATVTFRGDLHRPGTRPLRDVRIVANAAGTSHDRLTVVIDERLRAEFCGVGDEGEHTTFHGDVVVAFAPKMSGAPPVTGTLHAVALDVEPAAPAKAVSARREREAVRALEFFGIGVGPHEQERGLVVTSVARGGRGERAGLLVGDALVDVDGVSVYSLGDVVPQRGSRFSAVSVRRGRLPQSLEYRIDVVGFHTSAPTELLMAALLLGIVALVIALSSSRAARGVTWVARVIAARLSNVRSGSWRELRRIVTHRQEVLAAAPRGLAYLCCIGVAAAFTAAAFGQYIVSPDLDLPLAVVASTTTSLVSALVLGGATARPWSLTGGLRGVVQVLAHQLPVLFAVACSVVATGSVRLADAVHAQGAWPWQWQAFSTPATLVAFCLALASVVPAAPRTSAESRPLGLLTSLADWTNLSTVSALMATVFLGGWRVPEVHPAGASLVAAAAGALLLQLKCWSLVSVVLLCRWLLPALATSRTARSWWKWCVPSAAGCFVLSIGWIAASRYPAIRELADPTRWLVFCATAAVACLSAVTIQSHLRSATASTSVNPWI